MLTVSNSKGTDCSRSGSCMVCLLFRAGLRAGAYPRHANPPRRTERSASETAKGGTELDQTSPTMLAFSW